MKIGRSQLRHMIMRILREGPFDDRAEQLSELMTSASEHIDAALEDIDQALAVAKLGQPVDELGKMQELDKLLDGAARIATPLSDALYQAVLRRQGPEPD